MAQIPTRQRSLICTPTAVGVAQSWSFAVKKGNRVKSAAMQRAVSAAGGATSTFEARVDAAGGGAAAGLLGATLALGTVGSLVDGAGADLNSGRGFLVGADGTVVVTYTPTGGPGATIPSARFTFAIQQEFPF